MIKLNFRISQEDFLSNFTSIQQMYDQLPSITRTGDIDANITRAFNRIRISNEFFNPDAAGEIGIFIGRSSSNNQNDISSLMSRVSVVNTLSLFDNMFIAFRTDALCKDHPELNFFPCLTSTRGASSEEVSGASVRSNSIAHSASGHVVHGASIWDRVNEVATQAVKLYCESETAREVTSTAAGVAVAGMLVSNPVTVAATTQAAAIAVVVDKVTTRVINEICEHHKKTDTCKPEVPKEGKEPKPVEPGNDPKKSTSLAADQEAGPDCGLGSRRFPANPPRRFGADPEEVLSGSSGRRFPAGYDIEPCGIGGAHPQRPPRFGSDIPTQDDVYRGMNGLQKRDSNQEYPTSNSYAMLVPTLQQDSHVSREFGGLPKIGSFSGFSSRDFLRFPGGF